MPTLDELKQQIREEASSNPDKFFATDVIREKGFERRTCENCGTHFWTSDEERKVCGEPECSGGYTFIGDSPIEEDYSYVETWEMFRDFMADRGYEPIDRYPVVARWRDDVEFVGGAIYNFQPYVVSGEAEPPAPELVVPQPSLRFNDVDNVGVTGRHYVLHDHIGQTCFREPEEYDQDRYFRDMFEFAVDELGIPEKKLILHEDSWGGGGNLGPSMEFFVDGLELWNQVYMMYKQTPEGYEDLDLQVLDMGMGHERITWISHGDETSYESVMPFTLENMKERTGLEVDPEVWEEFLPYSSYLNIDEVEDIDEKWREIARDMDIDVEDLKAEIKPAAAMYSVAEHARALLFALADGKLPSNTGGGHNLRMVYRRAKDFIEKYNWDLDMKEVVEWNAQELEPMFPELMEKLDEVKKILEVEEEKYEKSRKKAREELERLDRDPSIDEMIELYESHGVSPEMFEERGFEVPEDFYARIASGEEAVKKVEEEFDLDDVPETEKLYYKDEKRKSCDAEVIATRDNWVILDRTVFYPEGGGQEPDHGTIDGEEVVDVQRQSDVILHHVPDQEFEQGDEVEARIDWDRRLQLMQHHSATHMVNHASRKILGNHIWQAGAHKTIEKGRLDVTHYEKLSRSELDRIEDDVRELISRDVPIDKRRVSKKEAEEKHGFRIYQGGVAAGNTVRLVEIEDLDVEACGGTHLSSTAEAGEFVVTRSRKVQDGVIRIEYKAGDAAEKYLENVKQRVKRSAEILGKSQAEPVENPREIEREIRDIYSVEPEQLVDTLERFREENQEKMEKVEKLANYLEREPKFQEMYGTSVLERAKSLFQAWKENDKVLEDVEEKLEPFLEDVMEDRRIEERVPTENVGLLIQVARKLAEKHDASVTLIGEKGAVSASSHEEFDADENLEEYSENVQGDENFAKAFDISA